MNEQVINIDEEDYISLPKRENRKRGDLIWGFVWLIIQLGLIVLFLSTGNFVTIIPIPLFFSIKSFISFFSGGSYRE